MKAFKTTLSLLLLLVFTGCSTDQLEKEAPTDPVIFPKGTKAPSEFFTGTAWVYGLVASDSIYNLNTGSVTFEPSARSNWHAHPPGQILIVTDGVGYHQIKGEPKQIIRKGDVVKCPPNKVHWHGASKDSSMTHIYVVPNTEKGTVDWMEPVTDEEFMN